MIKCNPKYTWCPKAIHNGNVRLAIVVDYPNNKDNEHFVTLKQHLVDQGYIVFCDYGSDMSYRDLMKDIDFILNNQSLPYVLFTRRSELLDNTYGRPDTMFMYYDNSDDREIHFGIAPFADLTQRDIREANNMMKLYWGGTFALELDETNNS